VFTHFVPGGRWDTPPLPATDAEPVRSMVHNEHRGAAVFQLPTQLRSVAAIPLVAAQVTCLSSDYDKKRIITS